jgi:hypothetical protein
VAGVHAALALSGEPGPVAQSQRGSIDSSLTPSCFARAISSIRVASVRSRPFGNRSA